MADWPRVDLAKALPLSLRVGLRTGVRGCSGLPGVVPLLCLPGALPIRESLTVSLAVDSLVEARALGGCVLLQARKRVGGTFNPPLLLLFVLDLSHIARIATGLWMTAGFARVPFSAHRVLVDRRLPVGAALLAVAACAGVGAAPGARHAGQRPERRPAFALGASVFMACPTATGPAARMTHRGTPE